MICWIHFGEVIESATVEIDGRLICQMDRLDACTWVASWDSAESGDGVHSLTVQARAASGLSGSDTIRILVNRRGEYQAPSRHLVDYENVIGEWWEKQILGTQLGPNENGHGWPSQKERGGAIL